MNVSDEVWMWLLHQKHGMIQIVWKLYSIKKNALTSLLPMMFYWIDETIHTSDELWMWVHQKSVMSWIIEKLY